MFKKAVLFGLLVTCFAINPVAASNCQFDSGFFAGGNLGYTYGSGSFNATFYSPFPVSTTNSDSGSGKSSAGLIGVVGGYREVFMPGYTLGLEVAGNYIGMNEIHKQFILINSPFMNRLKRTYNAVPSVVLGAILNNRWLATFGLGLGISRFHLFVDNRIAGVTAKASSTKLAFVPSLGVEYATSQNISLTGNVSYEIYQKIRNVYNSTVVPRLPGSNYTASISPNYFTVKAGFVFKF